METPEQLAERIAQGHAYEDHKDKFKDLGVNSREEFSDYLQGALKDNDLEAFSSCEENQTWRQADVFYNAEDNVMFVRPENKNDEPTAYRPSDGREAFDRKLEEASFIDGKQKETTNGFANFEEQKDATYFANAVEDSDKFPPKDEKMADAIEDRRSTESIEENLRKADGGDDQLSQDDKEAQMQERKEAYVAMQKQNGM